MSELPVIPRGARVPGGCGAGLTETYDEALRRALDHARRSGIRHAVTRVYTDPDDHWRDCHWKYAWVMA